MSETKDSSDGVDDGTAISVSTDDNQTREYLRVHPSEDGLDKSAVESQFRHLHELTVSEDSSLFEDLSDGLTSAVIECLLVSRDGAQTKIEYYFGVKNDRLDTLKRALRGVFPDTYELREESLCLAEVADLYRNEINDKPVPEWDQRQITGVTYNAKAKRRRDWQVGLDTETTTHPEHESVDGGYSDLPLAGILETMASTSETVIYQTLLEPMTDWTALADQRQGQLKRGRDRLLPRTIGSITANPNIDHEMTPAEKRRHDAIEKRDAHRSFSATARAAVITAPFSTKGRRVAKELASAFGSIGSKSYTIEGRVVVDDNPDRFLSTSIGPPTYEEASGLYENLCNRVVHPPDTDRFTTLAPWAKNRSPGIVVDAQEAPYLCLIGGETVTAEGNRALDVTPGEQTVLPLPPDKRLAIYRDPGLTLGHPVTQDGVALDMRIAVPPETQTKNTLISGTVGSGKSMLGISGFLDNHAATEGLDVLIDPKGGEAIDQYLLAHSIQFGDLDDVYYFDCADILPAFSFFDIRPTLDAGISRTTAIDNIVDQYTDILRQIMEGGNYGRAAKSPTIIRALIKALFDRVHGDESFTHHQLVRAAGRLSENQTAPATSNEATEEVFDNILEDSSDGIKNALTGVLTRLDKIALDDRLSRMLSYSPDDRDDAFDFRQYFDEDAVIIIDTGAVRDKSQSAMTLVILSMLWRALKRRKRESKLNTEQPLVNIYLDEASTVATSDMLGKMLAEGREFGCALILLTQYPEQFESDETEKDVAKEVYNNIGSIITSSVENDKRLAERLATDEESPQEIANRLGALNDGEWLLKLRSPYENRDPEMFIGRSQSLPPGHPDGDRQATEAELQTYENGYPATIDRAGEDAVSLDEPHPAESIQDGEELQRVDSALGLTQRLPDCVEYDEDRHAIKCESCQSHHDPNIDGMRRAINCCHDLDAVDRDDVPVCEINLKLTAEERAAAALTDRQLCFLQVVHDAQQGHHDPLEFDLIRDSMMRLKEYVDIDNEAVKELTNSDLMNRDTQPHLLYSVTADGRNVINETHRAGLDHGDGVGDLTESSQHIFAVEVARRYLEAAYVDNDESAVVEARPYYGVDDGHRLDLVGLDADGEIAVAVEVERSNPDRRSAAPADFDKIAATGCEDAIWVAMSRRKGHEILAALNDPDDGDPRVENTYSDGTPLSEVTIETEGLTDIYPVKHLRNTLDLEK